MPKLTNQFLAGLTIEDGRKDRLVFDTVCPGLGLRITTKGSRRFLVQWTDPATRLKVREPLGIWGNLTIDQARDAARVRLGAVAKGINPKSERNKQRAAAERQRAETALTFDALISEWVALHLSSRRPRYAVEAERALRYSFAHLMKRPAARITRADAVNALDKLVKGKKTAMASRTLAYARAAYGWAEKRGKVSSNPFKGLPIPTATASRDRVLTDEEIAEIWAAMGVMDYPWGLFFQMAMLTLQRREEVAGMRWSEISQDLNLWTIPGERMKNHKPHDVHLSKVAQELLAAVTKIDGIDYVFSTTGRTPVSGFSKAKAALDAAATKYRIEAATKAGTRADPLMPWRLHDLRRTGVSTLARLGFDSIVADKLLAHQPTRLHGVAAVYQRHDFAKERARALDAWAEHVSGFTRADNVVALQPAR